MSGGDRPAGGPPAGAPAREWPAVVLLLALAAGVRALRFWSDLAWPPGDEANVAIPAMQVLGGTFPVHHVGVEYVGATAAYPMAAWFAVVVVLFALGAVWGAKISVSTGVLWLLVCVAPPAVLLLVWRAPTQTVAELLYDANQPDKDGRS